MKGQGGGSRRHFSCSGQSAHAHIPGASLVWTLLAARLGWVGGREGQGRVPRCPGGAEGALRSWQPCAGLGVVFVQGCTSRPRCPCSRSPVVPLPGGSAGPACGSTSASCSGLAFDPAAGIPRTAAQVLGQLLPASWVRGGRGESVNEHCVNER